MESVRSRVAILASSFACLLFSTLAPQSVVCAEDLRGGQSPPFARIAGTVKNAPPGTRVLVRRTGGDEVSNVPCDEKTGRYVIGGLSPGRYDLLVLASDGHAWFGVDGAAAHALSEETRAEVTSLMRRYSDWRNGVSAVEGILSRSFVRTDGKDYDSIVQQDRASRQAVALRRRTSPPGKPEETFRWRVTVEKLLKKGDGSVLAVVRETFSRSLVVTKAQMTCSTEWLGLVARKEEKGWRITSSFPLVDRLQPAKTVTVVQTGKLDNIAVEAGELSDGHDLDLRTAKELK